MPPYLPLVGESDVSRESDLSRAVRAATRLFLCESHQIIFTTLDNMARLRVLSRETLQRDLPNKDKIKLALEFLHENPNETPTAAARLFHLKKEDSVRKAWLRAKRKGPEPKKKGGQNKILRPDQNQAMIR